MPLKNSFLKCKCGSEKFYISEYNGFYNNRGVACKNCTCVIMGIGKNFANGLFENKVGMPVRLKVKNSKDISITIIPDLKSKFAFKK
jgi:hypothetical protein